MKSVGETMAFGRTFQQAFAKALRSRELDKPPALGELDEQQLLARLQIPLPDRFEVVLELLAPRRERRGRARSRRASTRGSCDELRALALDPDAPFAGERSFMSVDTCAAEFPARTPYYYSGWERPRAGGVATRCAARATAAALRGAPRS